MFFIQQHASASVATEEKGQWNNHIHEPLTLPFSLFSLEDFTRIERDGEEKVIDQTGPTSICIGKDGVQDLHGIDTKFDGLNGI